MKLEFRGIHQEFIDDTTGELDLEGALSSGKTIAALYKELAMAAKYPGIHSLICRWTDDATHTLLRPAFEEVARLRGDTLEWNDKLKFYTLLDYGSRIYAFGLKTQSSDAEQRYGKIRGLPVSRIYVDQAEQIPGDIASELRFRLRPNLTARLRNEAYPTQLTFSPNPTNDDHWLAKQFPETNWPANRRYYALSLFDNQHNLDPQMIENLLREFPPEHPKHRTMILGKRGLNVTGVPVYEGAFKRALHTQAVTVNALAPLEEGFDFGKHHPCVVWRQRTPYGGVVYLGGLMGQGMNLEDFLPIVRDYRDEWFGDLLDIKTCCGPVTQHGSSAGVAESGLKILQASGFRPVWQSDADRPSVRYAMVEQSAALMRRRTVQGEAFLVNNDPTRWLRVFGSGSPPVQWNFLTDGCEGGYVWDEHVVSEGSKQYRKPKKDSWYEHGQTCMEYLERNFGHRPFRRTGGTTSRDWNVVSVGDGTWQG